MNRRAAVGTLAVSSRLGFASCLLHLLLLLLLLKLCNLPFKVAGLNLFGDCSKHPSSIALLDLIHLPKPKAADTAAPGLSAPFRASKWYAGQRKQAQPVLRISIFCICAGPARSLFAFGFHTSSFSAGAACCFFLFQMPSFLALCWNRLLLLLLSSLVPGWNDPGSG